MTKYMLYIVIIALVPALTYSSPITISAAGDTFITEMDAFGGVNANGGSDYVRIAGGTPGLHRTYPLLKFDLTPFSGMMITSPTVDLTLNLRVGWNYEHVTQSISVREALSTWDEEMVTWANFGGTGFNPAIHTGLNLTTRDVTYNGIIEPVIFSIPSATVQGWIDSPSSNNGVFLISNTSASNKDLNFFSKETGVVPQLTLEAIPEPASASLIALVSGGFCFIRRRIMV